jgi:D-aminopeptidase
MFPAARESDTMAQDVRVGEEAMNRREFSRLVVGVSAFPSAEARVSNSVTIPDMTRLARKIRPGVFESGKHNDLTDIDGVRVGHATLVEGDSIRTGVTAILPHRENIYQRKVPGAVYVGNAFGKLAGSTQVNELGNIEAPIILTNTLSVGAGVAGGVKYVLAQPGNEKTISVNVLVGETNDGILNDIRAMRVTPEDVLTAIADADAEPVKQGCVGAGTGTICFGWKGGMGSASRVLPPRYGGWSVGALVQTNYGGLLMMNGFHVGEALGAKLYPADGSCMIVVATDAPLEHRSLYRLAKRSVFGLARTGSAYSNGSGEFSIAFTTFKGNRVAHGANGPADVKVLSNDSMSPLFQAVLEVVEEAVYSSLLHATTTTGNGNTILALPIDRLWAVLANISHA